MAEAIAFEIQPMVLRFVETVEINGRHRGIAGEQSMVVSSTKDEATRVVIPIVGHYFIVSVGKTDVAVQRRADVVPTFAIFVAEGFHSLASVGINDRAFVLQQRNVFVDVDHHIVCRTPVGSLVGVKVDGASVDGRMLGFLVAVAQGGMLVHSSYIMAVEHFIQAPTVVEHDAIRRTYASVVKAEDGIVVVDVASS